MKIKLKEPKENPITLEVILQNERLKRGWNYENVAKQLATPNITAKNVKKWEYSFEYPDLNTIYKISELYQIPSEILVQAKSNGYSEGLHSVHKLFIKTICYIFNLPIKAMVIFSYIFLYILLPLAGVGAIFLFASKITI